MQIFVQQSKHPHIFLKKTNVGAFLLPFSEQLLCSFWCKFTCFPRNLLIFCLVYAMIHKILKNKYARVRGGFAT